MPEHEVKESGLDVDLRFTDPSAWFSNYRIGETAGATKILVDKSTDRIIGAYAELANTIALAMKNGLTTRQIKATTAAYPSTGSDLGSMV